MADYKSYRRKKVSNNYLSNGFKSFVWDLKKYSTIIPEFEMYKDMFNLVSTYRKLSKDYSIISYFDLKDKTIDIKVLDKETKKAVFFDTYSLTQTSYLIMRETRNYKNGLYTKTVANPVKKYHHASLYMAKVYNKATKKLENKVVIIRNKSDFMNNFDCYYVVKDEFTNGEYKQIEGNISSMLLAYNNQTYPTSTELNSIFRKESERDIFKYKSNRDMFYNNKTARYNTVNEPINSKNIIIDTPTVKEETNVTTSSKEEGSADPNSSSDDVM